MGLIRYISMTFRRDFKSNIFYVLAMTLSICLIFNTFNVIYNDSIINRDSNEYQTLIFLSLCLVAVVTVFMLFSNSYYIESKMKEYGIITFSGRSVYEICVIIIIRNFFSTTLSVILGCTLGYFTAPIINSSMYSLVGINGDLHHVSIIGLVMTILLLGIQFLVVFLTNTSTIYKKKVTELVKYSSTPFMTDKRTIKINSKVYFGLFLFPLIFCLLPIDATQKMGVLSYLIVLCCFGTMGVVRYYIPSVIEKKKKNLIIDRYKLVYLNNLFHSIEKSSMLIVVLVIAVTLSIGTACSYDAGSVMNILGLLCYGIIISVMSITIIYKFLIEAFSRKGNFKQLSLLGYTKHEIKKIIKKEVLLFYGIIFSVCLLHPLILVVMSVIAGFSSATLGVELMLSFILSFIISGFISYILYKSVALKAE